MSDVAKIKKLLSSTSLGDVRKGLDELLAWVEAQQEDGDVDLRPVGYKGSDDATPEANPLFDKLLEQHGAALGPDGLLTLLQSLFNGTEEWLNCGAALTVSRLVLKGADDKLQARWVDVFIGGIRGYEPCHRFYEESVLDVLIDDVLPTLDPPAIAKLVEWASNDLLAPPPGDNLLSVLAAALGKKPTLDIEERLATRAATFLTDRRDSLGEELANYVTQIGALCSADNKAIIDGVTSGANTFADIQALFKKATTDVKSLEQGLLALGGLSKKELDTLREPVYKGIKVQGGKLSFDIISSALDKLLVTRGAKDDEKVMSHLIRYAAGYHAKKIIPVLAALAQDTKRGGKVIEALDAAKHRNPLDHEYVMHADGSLHKRRDNPYAKHDFNEAVKATITKTLDTVLAKAGHKSP